MNYEEKVDTIKSVLKSCHKLPDDDLFSILDQVWKVLEKQKK